MNSAYAQQGTTAEGEAIRLLVHGFTPTERKMLDAFVKLTWRHGQRIELLAMDDVNKADAVMIDATDPTTPGWVKSLPWLKSESVIWVDADDVDEDSTVLHRPVQWYELPLLLKDIVGRTSSSLDTAPAVSPSVAAAHAGVLVVDDSIAVRSMLRSLLETQGLQVTDVDNANDALTLVSENPYSCVLLDVLMPGMDGYEACRKIKANAYGGTAPAVVMLTSKSSVFDQIRGKMVGSDAYLTKPVEQHRLLEVVGNFIGQSPTASPHG